MATRPRIVVGVDGSPGSRQALQLACDEARLRGGQVEAVWARGHHDLRPSPWESRPEPDSSGIWAEVQLNDFISDATPGNDPTVIASAVNELAAPALLDAASNADLLVVGARGRGGFPGLSLGSVTHQVLSRAPCPVLVVRARPSDATTHGNVIIVGADGSEHSRRALGWAQREAGLRGARVLLVHGWSAPLALTDTVPSTFPSTEVYEEAAQALVATEVSRARSDAPEVEVEGRATSASGASALIETSRRALLTVVGSRRLGPAGVLMGSVSQQVAQHAECPVAVIPAP